MPGLFDALTIRDLTFANRVSSRRWAVGGKSEARNPKLEAMIEYSREKIRKRSDSPWIISASLVTRIAITITSIG
jgi:hypothetical protein